MRTHRTGAVARALVAAGVALAALAAPAGTIRGAGPEEYRQGLEEAERLLTQGGSSARQAAARIRALPEIASSSGWTIRPDNSQIIADLEATPPRTGPALARLRSLLRETEASGPTARNLAAHDQLRQLLATTDPGTSFMSELLRRLPLVESLLKALEEFFASLGRAVPSGLEPNLPAVRGMTPFLAVALFVALAAVVALTVRRALGPGVQRAPTAAPPDTVHSAAMREAAARLAGSGAYRDALRELYLATLVKLAEDGRLKVDPGTTNRELVGRIRSRADRGLLAVMEPLVQRFDVAWYGRRPCSEEDYRDFARLAAPAW